MQNKSLFILCFLFLVAPVYSQPFPDFPPENVTATMDRDQMLWQLGISFPQLPAKLQDPNAPRNAFPSDSLNPEGHWTDTQGHIITRSPFGLWNNYSDFSKGIFPGPDSTRVGFYTPIDLLKAKDGSRITTATQWWEKQRPEILKDVQEHVWGKIPPDSILPKVVFSVESTVHSEQNPPYAQKEMTGWIDISRYPQVRNKPKILATLRIPANAQKPVPVMIIISGSFFAKWAIDMYWKHCAPQGWGLCVLNTDSLQPDHGAGLTSYLIGLCNKGNWRKPSDWGTLAAWSWGVSRLVDYFETDPNVDAKKIGVTGHSRYGKAALLAMAYDTRLAIAFPSCAGSLGTKMNRRHWGQDLENSAWDREYHWVAGNFFKWMGELYPGQYLPRKIELCPVDAHSLLALCAPRPVFLNAGYQDTWTDPYGIYLTGVYATPVYELLGKKGLIMPDPKPGVDKAYIEGDIGYRLHKEGHVDAPDWPMFFEFAKKYGF